MAIGGTNPSLSSLQAVGTEENPASDAVSVSTVDEFGTELDSYTWNDWAASTPCWADGDYNPVEGVTLTPGQAFWTAGAGADQSIQSCGEVGLQDVVVTLRNGFSLIGNPFPVALELQDIVAGTNDEDAPASDSVSMSIIDAFGTEIEAYTWNDWTAETPCWADGDYNPVVGVKIAPGQGLWTAGSSDAQFVRFPAPEL